MRWAMMVGLLALGGCKGLIQMPGAYGPGLAPPSTEAAQPPSVPEPRVESAPSVPPPPRIMYHLVVEQALFCRSPDAVIALSEPGARERWGEINYMQIAMRGDCAHIGNSRRLVACFIGPRVSYMAQLFEFPDGTSSGGRCYFILNDALADDAGNQPRPKGE
jgi:hypothetical protein